MIPSTFQYTPANPQGQVLVELSAKRLPPRMRLGRLRSSILVSFPRARVVMGPVTLVTRLFNR